MEKNPAEEEEARRQEDLEAQRQADEAAIEEVTDRYLRLKQEFERKKGVRRPTEGGRQQTQSLNIEY